MILIPVFAPIASLVRSFTLVRIILFLPCSINRVTIIDFRKVGQKGLKNEEKDGQKSLKKRRRWDRKVNIY